MMFLGVLGFISLIVIIYIATYVLNKNTKPPLDVNIDGCKGCNTVGCNNHPSHQDKEEEV